MNPPPFTHFGRYRILEELGRGAMGIVYLAEDESLQRRVAVKAMLLPPDAAERDEQEARFRQEAKAAGGLSHPNIITIHDLGREGDWLYIAMELLRGTELKTMMTVGAMPLPLALDIAAQVAEGLAAAHSHGVVHRDIKPSNIMVMDGRHAKIMDFGVARMQASEVRTRSGVLLGSPKYMSPEQVGGHAVDARSDIFSLGSMLYEMVTGQPAFGGAELGNLLYDILHGQPTPASRHNPAVPQMLDLVLARAMQKNPGARYQDAREMARDLEACLGGAPAPVPVGAATVADATLFSSTVRADATVTLASPVLALLPAVQFDSRAALQCLLKPEAQAAAGAGGGAFLRKLAWPLVYVAALAGAVAIALT
ncbi:serine/threonine protein kinase [Ramlibacter sp. G-1-2-2]|uniref:non-specific serine/threonine protein kinase n=1 Tax=Ramlibacter agri TaxID=2728837 RepID=A0A848HKP0_9BURK|nr:serine/threonine-protein kinase [Ramlibacter agri]NML48298.1 serine/threonine protein kinase [Ramlibacter agri]